MKKVEVLYIAISADRFELPLCAFDTLAELASWADLDKQKLIRFIKTREVDTRNRCMYLKLKISIFFNLQKNNFKNDDNF